MKAKILITFLFVLLTLSYAIAAPAVIIKNVSDSPDPFSPNKDGIKDETTISAAISVSGFISSDKKDNKAKLELNWKLIISDFKGKRIRLFVNTEKMKDDSEIQVSEVWDGTDSGKKLVPDGKYSYRIEAKIREVEAKPGFGDVTVKTISVLSVSVSPDFWNIGQVESNSVTTMKDRDKITVLNDGRTNATYSLCLINPEGWISSTTATGAETYILNAAFSQKLKNIIWREKKHAVSDFPIRSTSTKFAGDQTGVNVKPNQIRMLWFQFKAPATTAIFTEQKIEVIVTAEVP